MWAAIASTFLGIWLMVAPAILDLHGLARAHAHVVGPLVVTFAAIAISQVTRSVRRVNALLGVFLVLAPLLFGYGFSSAAVHSIVVGIATFALSLPPGTPHHQQGGGWRSMRAG
jgi:hypothetical protein